MDRPSRLNPHAAPFVPSSRSSFTESMRESKDPGKQVSDTEKHETVGSSAGHDELPDPLSLDEYCAKLGKLKISTKSKGKGKAAGGVIDPSRYEGSGVDNHSAMVRCISRIFPDVDADFIFEALKAHDFDADSTLNMMFHLCAPAP